MSTNHEGAAQALLRKMMQDPNGPAVIEQAREQLRNGHWSPEYVRDIGQIHARSPHGWPAEQVASFLLVHAKISEGTAAMVQVLVGAEPSADAERAKNAEALAKLPPPFTAKVSMTQSGGDADGTLSWSEPVVFTLAAGEHEVGEDGVSRPVTRRLNVGPTTMPLEIGTTLPSRTRLHLLSDMGVARWAYGSTLLRVLIHIGEPELWSVLGES